LIFKILSLLTPRQIDYVGLVRNLSQIRTLIFHKTTWLDNTTSWTRLSLTELVTNVEDRHQWRKIVYDAANPRNEDG